MPVPSRSSRLLLCALSALPWLMLGVEWFLVLPRFARLFDRYQLSLPTVSRWTVAAVRWAGENFFFAGWAWLMCMILSMSAVSRVMRREMPARGRNLRLLAVFALPLIVFLGAWLGIHDPYSRLMQGLGR